jgi:hypothetical protein
MDWKFAHFNQEAVFQAEPQVVFEALRAFAGDWLADWKVSETSDGLEARGYSGLHSAIANFRIEPAAVGARLMVEMQVKRASARGFMLVDIGGFYNGHIQKWLQAIHWWVNQKQTAATESEGQPRKAGESGPPTPKPMPSQNRLLGCGIIVIVLIFALYFCVTTICAVIGLITGNLYLTGRGGDITIHGGWARIVSAAILLFFGWIGFRIWKPKDRNRGSGWLPPPSR